jgi:hypothetical protein
MGRDELDGTGTHEGVHRIPCEATPDETAIGSITRRKFMQLPILGWLARLE